MNILSRRIILFMSDQLSIDLSTLYTNNILKSLINIFLPFLQLPPRLIKLTLVTCLLVVIISQTDCAEGKIVA